MIVELHLHRPAEFYPGWHPGLGGTRAQYAFRARDGYEIVREGHVYIVSKEHDGKLESCEVPVANVRSAPRAAVSIEAPKQAQTKGGKR